MSAALTAGYASARSRGATVRAWGAFYAGGGVGGRRMEASSASERAPPNVSRRAIVKVHCESRTGTLCFTALLES